MQRGEVWWAVPKSTGGNKRRPVLVVSNDVFNQNTRHLKIVVVHLTTTVHEGAPYLWEVELPRGAAGLGKTSIAKCAEPYTLFKEALTAQIGRLSAQLMSEIDLALARALSLPPAA